MKEYQTLRYISHVIIVLGWSIIIFGWVFGFIIEGIYGETLESFANVSNALNGEEDVIVSSRSPLIIIATGMLFSLQGLFIIASGQVFLVLLDIRDDTRTQLSVMRRFTIWYAKNQDNEEDTQ